MFLFSFTHLLQQKPYPSRLSTNTTSSMKPSLISPSGNDRTVLWTPLPFVLLCWHFPHSTLYWNCNPASAPLLVCELFEATEQILYTFRLLASNAWLCLVYWCSVYTCMNEWIQARAVGYDLKSWQTKWKSGLTWNVCKGKSLRLKGSMLHDSASASEMPLLVWELPKAEYHWNVVYLVCI